LDELIQDGAFDLVISQMSHAQVFSVGMTCRRLSVECKSRWSAMVSEPLIFRVPDLTTVCRLRSAASHGVQTVRMPKFRFDRRSQDQDCNIGFEHQQEQMWFSDLIIEDGCLELVCAASSWGVQFSTRAANHAARQGRLDLLKCIGPSKVSRLAFDNAIAAGNMDVIAWMMEVRRDLLLDAQEWRLKDVVQKAALKGRTDLLQAIHSARPEIICDEPAMSNAICGDHLHTLMWLHEEMGGVHRISQLNQAVRWNRSFDMIRFLYEGLDGQTGHLTDSLTVALQNRPIREDVVVLLLGEVGSEAEAGLPHAVFWATRSRGDALVPRLVERLRPSTLMRIDDECGAYLVYIGLCCSDFEYVAWLRSKGAVSDAAFSSAMDRLLAKVEQGGLERTIVGDIAACDHHTEEHHLFPLKSAIAGWIDANRVHILL
jgi:hypothetical protein